MKFTHLLHFASFALVAWSTTAQAASGSGIAIPGGSVSVTYVISKPGAYYLAGERVMTDNTKPIISIASDDVTLDLSGYSVSFADASTGNSPAIHSSKTNVEVRNGSVLNAPNTGINLQYATQCRIIDVRVSDVVIGAGIVGGSSGLVQNCDLFNCNIGISIEGGSTIENCRVTKSGTYGMYVGTDSIVRSNVINVTKTFGIIATGGCLIEGNTVRLTNSSNDNVAGIWVSGAGNTVRNNSLSQCKGVSISTGGRNVVDGNTIWSNDTVHTALDNGSSTASVSRNNNISAKTAMSGLWINAGGNVNY